MPLAANVLEKQSCGPVGSRHRLHVLDKRVVSVILLRRRRVILLRRRRVRSALLLKKSSSSLSENWSESIANCRGCAPTRWLLRGKKKSHAEETQHRPLVPASWSALPWARVPWEGSGLADGGPDGARERRRWRCLRWLRRRHPPADALLEERCRPGEQEPSLPAPVRQPRSQLRAQPRGRGCPSPCGRPCSFAAAAPTCSRRRRRWRCSSPPPGG